MPADKKPGSIRELVEELNSAESFLGGPHLRKGKCYRHPESGKLLRITSGQYMGYDPIGRGGISNHWYWEYLDEHHMPTGEKGYGYGWAAKPIEALTCPTCKRPYEPTQAAAAECAENSDPSSGSRQDEGP